ncbi:MAG: hypothetical protein IJ735_06390 [Clostridia bacterium]|nr:hypothetical protein [Clostridia bacterium]
MIASVVIVIITFLLLTSSVVFFPSVKVGRIKIGPYWVIALVGATVLLCAGLAPATEVWSAFTSDSAVNPLKILTLFFSMTFLSVYLDETGFFRYLAKKAVDAAGGSARKLFLLVYLLTALLTVFTSNDVVILTLTPFLCFFCKNTKLDPVPFLVGEFAAANTYSMALVIGNPTNIFLATSAGIGFVDYLKVMILPTIVAGLIELSVILLVFNKSLKSSPDRQPVTCVVESKIDLVFGGVTLAICLVFLVLSGYIRTEMWLISAICAGALLLFALIRRFSKAKDKRLVRSLVRLPWQLIPFVLSMFVIVVCLQHWGLSDKIGEMLGDKYVVFSYGAASYLVANVINNIPMSMLFSALPVGLTSAEYLRAIYASIVGSNLGAFLTPIGALAGIMFTGLLEKYDVSFGFRTFVKYGFIVGLPTLAAALTTLFFLL